MSAQNFFYLTLGFGAVIVTAVFLIFALQIILLLRKINQIAENLKNSTKELELMKEKAKLNLLTALGKLLKKFI